MDLKSKFLAGAICIVLTFFVFYGIETFYPSPGWEDFCGERDYQPINTQAACQAKGGLWTPNDKDPNGGWCDQYHTCQKEYDNAREPYEKNVFAIGTVVGTILFIIGFQLVHAPVGAGILGGSLLVLFITLTSYWHRLADLTRFVILGVILAALIWLGYNKLTPKGEKITKGKSKGKKKK